MTEKLAVEKNEYFESISTWPLSEISCRFYSKVIQSVLWVHLVSLILIHFSNDRVGSLFNFRKNFGNVYPLNPKEKDYEARKKPNRYN